MVIKNGGWPAFAVDSGSIYFHCKHADKWGIWRVKLDGSDQQRITLEDIEAFTPRASADGKRLVAAVQRGQHRQIEIFDVATKSVYSGHQRAG